jgi:hypothetical protein
MQMQSIQPLPDPIDESVGGMAKKSKTGFASLSEWCAEPLTRGNAVHPLFRFR